MYFFFVLNIHTFEVRKLKFKQIVNIPMEKIRHNVKSTTLSCLKNKKNKKQQHPNEKQNKNKCSLAIKLHQPHNLRCWDRGTRIWVSLSQFQLLQSVSAQN